MCFLLHHVCVISGGRGVSRKLVACGIVGLYGAPAAVRHREKAGRELWSLDLLGDKFFFN